MKIHCYLTPYTKLPQCIKNIKSETKCMEETDTKLTELGLRGVFVN